MHDVALILAYTTASCGITALVGLIALRLLRGRTLRMTVVCAALLPMLGVAVSVWVNVRAMVLSRHDAGVVLITLGWATGIAVLMTVAVGRRVADGSQALRAGLQRLDGHVAEGSPVVPPAELVPLVAELDAVRERLTASRTRERALETSRRELVTFMSHDLRTPLTGLRALAEGIDDGVVDDVPDAMKRIHAYVDRLTSLVDDLFELSRVTGGAPRRPRQLVSLAEVAMDVVAEAGDHARSRCVALELDLLAPGDRLPVLGDGDELARAMSNLVANAVRHTAPAGTVRVVGDRGPDGQVRLSVLDGCGGIPGHHLPHVFEAGWRGEVARTDDVTDDGGGGFGLAIARGVAEAHAGRIAVQNVDGGCRFELALPTAPS